jgi:hypothetical protein
MEFAQEKQRVQYGRILQQGENIRISRKKRSWDGGRVLLLVRVPRCDVMMLRACPGHREDQNHKKMPEV